MGISKNNKQGGISISKAVKEQWGRQRLIRKGVGWNRKDEMGWAEERTTRTSAEEAVDKRRGKEEGEKGSE